MNVQRATADSRDVTSYVFTSGLILERSHMLVPVDAPTLRLVLLDLISPFFHQPISPIQEKRSQDAPEAQHVRPKL